jgi:hypothetical protein
MAAAALKTEFPVCAAPFPEGKLNVACRARADRATPGHDEKWFLYRCGFDLNSLHAIAFSDFSAGTRAFPPFSRIRGKLT